MALSLYDKTDSHCGLTQRLRLGTRRNERRCPTSAALSALVATLTSGPAGKHRLNPADDSAYLFQINPWPPVHRLGSEGVTR